MLIWLTNNIGTFKNTVSIKRDKFLGKYIPKVDLVLGRAGFNTISEVLYYKKPSIFLSSKNNPEINWNLSKIISSDLSLSVDIEYFYKNFVKIIFDFMNYHSERKIINIKKSKFKFDGQIEICKEIIKIND